MKTQRSRDKIWVQWQGRLYGMPLASPRRGRAGAEAAQELVAPFSCKVLKIHVKPGQAVKKGDPVLVVEAMKMEYGYTSPRDGVVESVPVKEGEVVNGGTQFVRWREK